MWKKFNPLRLFAKPDSLDSIAAPTKPYEPPPNFDELCQNCYFNVKELKKLYERYNAIKDPYGNVTLDIFCGQPEVANCKLIIFGFLAFVPKTSTLRYIDFNDYVLLLSKFSSRSQKEEKTKCNTRPLLNILYIT